MYRRLIKTERSMDDMVNSVLCIMAFTTHKQGHAFAQNLNVLLQPEHEVAKENMQRMAGVMGRDTDEVFLQYSWELQRHDPQVGPSPSLGLRMLLC